MSIIYIVIARQDTYLADYTNAEGGNFQSVTKQVITKITPNSRQSFEYSGYNFHSISENDINFVCMCDKTFELRNAFAFLEDVQSSFNSQTSEIERNQAIAFSMNRLMQKQLKTKFEYFNSKESDKINQLKQNIEAAKEVLIINLDKMSERGEKLDIICKKSQDMQQVSTNMRKQAATVHSTMRWRNYKMYIVLAIIVIAVIAAILLICLA